MIKVFISQRNLIKKYVKNVFKEKIFFLFLKKFDLLQPIILYKVK